MFSPVIKSITIRITITLDVSNHWPILQIDVNNAFLNRELKEIVYMSRPQWFIDPLKSNHVCRLVKAVYGLKQAPKALYEKLKKTISKGVCECSCR